MDDSLGSLSATQLIRSPPLDTGTTETFPGWTGRRSAIQSIKSSQLLTSGEVIDKQTLDIGSIPNDIAS